MRKLIGIQTGPRQFELPPNMFEVESAGSYRTVKEAPSSLST